MSKKAHSGRVKTGRRSKEKLAERAKKRLMSGQQLKASEKAEEHVYHVEVTSYPEAFVHTAPVTFKKNMQKHVPAPFQDPDNLHRLPEHGKILVPTPLSTTNLPTDHPQYLAMRFDKVISPRIINNFIFAWDTLQATDVKHLLKQDKNRCKKNIPAFHFGIWEKYSHGPILSSETRNQTPQTIAAIDVFLALVGRFVAPRVLSFLQSYFPQQKVRLQRFDLP
ncbi:hypothetical protein BV22DRAFT_1135365 [Leucogyrophana mollusca]|uniref:Uncharacterized protein n=1 Tax=Leucogyrophana mollusca TaxID=85980 RepID=A0ACB8AVG9_9AGAM|nr:hypothetical protein BV22DRAFT_1135365 [Leucogyrophana mollusca]